MSLVRNVPDFELIQLGRLLYVCPNPWEFIVVEQKCSGFWTHSIGQTIICLSKSLGIHCRWPVMFRILNSLDLTGYYMSVQILGNLLSLISKTPDFEFIELGRPLYVCPSPWEFIVLFSNVPDVDLIGLGRLLYISVHVLGISLSLSRNVPEFELI